MAKKDQAAKKGVKPQLPKNFTTLIEKRKGVPKRKRQFFETIDSTDSNSDYQISPDIEKRHLENEIKSLRAQLNSYSRKNQYQKVDIFEKIQAKFPDWYSVNSDCFKKDTLIEFYFDKEPIGISYLPNKSNENIRRFVAQQLGIKRYDHFLIYRQEMGMSKTTDGAYYDQVQFKSIFPRTRTDEFRAIG